MVVLTKLKYRYKFPMGPIPQNEAELIFKTRENIKLLQFLRGTKRSFSEPRC